MGVCCFVLVFPQLLLTTKGLSRRLQKNWLMPFMMTVSLRERDSQEKVNFSPYFHISFSLALNKLFNLYSASSIFKMKKYLATCNSDTIRYF